MLVLLVAQTQRMVTTVMIAVFHLWSWRKVVEVVVRGLMVPQDLVVAVAVVRVVRVDREGAVRSGLMAVVLWGQIAAAAAAGVWEASAGMEELLLVMAVMAYHQVYLEHLLIEEQAVLVVEGTSASASAVGGNGGGGDGSSNAASATAGTPNTGSGGGGGKDTSGVKSNGAAGGSGIVIIRYLSALPAGFRTVNERVLVQDEDGWLLMAAYNHQAGTNPNLVSGTTPSSATEGFSHIWPGTHLGLTASDIAEVRFYCHSSNHNRVINFSVNNDWVKTAILTGSISGNSVTYWTSGTTKLDGHTANLPDATNHVWPNQGSGSYPVTFFDFPFFQLTLHIGL